MGYVSIGKSSPAAFAEAVRSNAPPIEDHVAVEYPKWIGTKLVKSAEEEAALRPPSSEVTAASSRDVSRPETVMAL
jgi:hypothetical protein